MTVLSSEAAEDRDQTHLTGFRSATKQAKMPKETEQAFLEKLVPSVAKRSKENAYTSGT